MKTAAEGKLETVEQRGTAVLDKGTRLGEYAIERLIGVGSMGAVYEAVCTPTGQRFAVKVLSAPLAAVPVARARFLKEAKLTARVRHPHIVDVSDVGEDAGRVYLVMELLAGEDLAHRVQRGPLSTVETADIMLPVCDAVAEAHRRGVTHRDLKPSNIFLLVRGRRPYPVVLDFGIAKDDDKTSVDEAPAAVPARPKVFGTPSYLAPEQIGDHRAAGPASDQFALGVILYECLTGRLPFRADTVTGVFRAIAAGNPAPPSARRAEVSPEMDALVLRALATDPKARFESVAELRSALLPFTSKATGAAPAAAYRRTPTSPAIDVEASTPTPFVRTLTPEIQPTSGAWAAVAETSDVIAGEAVPSSPIAAEAAPDAEASPALELEEDLAAVRNGIWATPSRRIWIGAVAGLAAASLALVLVVKRARRPPAIPTPAAEALVQIEPAAAKPAADNAAASAAEVPAAEAKPVPAVIPAAPGEAPAVNEAPTTAAAAEAPTGATEAAPAALAAKEAPAVAAAAPKESPTAAVEPPAAPKKAVPAPAEPEAAPKQAAAAPAEPAPARDEPAALAPEKASAEVEPARARKPASKPASKPRTRAAVAAPSGVRMHNGVPLLD